MISALWNWLTGAQRKYDDGYKSGLAYVAGGWAAALILVRMREASGRHPWDRGFYDACAHHLLGQGWSDAKLAKELIGPDIWKAPVA